MSNLHGPDTKTRRYAIHRLQTVDRFCAGDECVGSSSSDATPENQDTQNLGIDTLIHAEDLCDFLVI